MAENSQNRTHKRQGPLSTLGRPALVFGFLQIFSFTLFAPRLGFYSDDWNWLEVASGASGLLSGVHRFAAAWPTLWPRMLDMAIYPALYWIAGMRPWAYQLLCSALNVGEAILLFCFLEAVLKSPGLSAIAAALSILYPGRIPTHIWANNAPQAVAHILMLASLLAHLRWVEKKKLWQLAAGQFLYLCGLMSYESIAFMPLLLGGGLWVQQRLKGETAAAALRRTAWDLAPYGPTLLLSLWWQYRGVYSLILGGGNPKSSLLSPSFGHLLKVYSAGLECLSTNVLHICFTAARKTVPIFTWPGGILWAAFTALASRLLGQEFRRECRPSAWPIAWGLCASGFIAAYLPYALSSGYEPAIFSVNSRVNGTGAWVFGLAWACGLWGVGRRWPILRQVLLAAAIGAFTWTNWAILRDWAAAWQVEQKILAKYAKEAPSWPSHAHILLVGATPNIGNAPVFDETWSFAPALRLSTGRKDITAEVKLPWQPTPYPN